MACFCLNSASAPPDAAVDVEDVTKFVSKPAKRSSALVAAAVLSYWRMSAAWALALRASIAAREVIGVMEFCFIIFRGLLEYTPFTNT